MKSLLWLAFLVIWLSACNSNSQSDNSSAINQQEVAEALGLTLMKTQCYACHNPAAASHDDLLAPPFVAVKRHYIDEYPNQDEFVKAITTNVLSPDSNTALMFGAISEFGLMPKQAFQEDEVRTIAEYLYSNALEEPVWFQKHMRQMYGEGQGGGKGRQMRKRNR